MDGSDNDYVASDSADDAREHQVGGSDGRAVRKRSQPHQRRNGQDRSNGRVSGNSQSQQARWEMSIDKSRGSQVIAQDNGSLGLNIARIQAAQKRARLRKDTQPFQRGIIRHLVLVLDLSESMLDKDMRPNRFRVMVRCVDEYIREFFEQNPISQLTVLAMYDGKCIKVSQLSGNPNEHIAAVQALLAGDGKETPAREPKGSPSLQNALEMSRAMLYHTPKHGTREVVIVLGALLTNDPGDIHETVASCAKDRLKVSIIGMLARIKVCGDIVAATNDGDDSAYTIAVDEINLRQLLMTTTAPPVLRAAEQDVLAANLLVMGFPSRMDEAYPSLCACHGSLQRGGYACPRCRTKVCSLPQTCPACNLTLILSTHLARSYHHLFPLRNWVEVPWQRARDMASVQCKACLVAFPPIPDPFPLPDATADLSNGLRPQSRPQDTLFLPDTQKDTLLDGASESSRYECQSCHHHFCVDCDVFCHQTIFNCPGCLSGSPVMPMLDEPLSVNGDTLVANA